MKSARNYKSTIENDLSMSMSTVDLNNSVFINNKDSNKGSRETIKKRCYDLVSLPNEPKYRDYIENIFKENNDKFIIKNSKDKFFCEKLREIKEYAQSLKFIEKIKISDFKKIREFAISKGGFLTYDVRKILYKKIYLINHKNMFKMVYIDYGAIINRNWDFDKIDIFSSILLLLFYLRSINYLCKIYIFNNF